jgi:hypothetical protein
MQTGYLQFALRISTVQLTDLWKSTIRIVATTDTDIHDAICDIHNANCGYPQFNSDINKSNCGSSIPLCISTIRNVNNGYP